MGLVLVARPGLVSCAWGLVPVLLVPFFLARIPETSRFQRHDDDAPPASMGGLAALITPLRALAITHPGRAAGIAAAGFLTSIAIMPSFQFSSFYVQEKLGWEPTGSWDDIARAHGC